MNDKQKEMVDWLRSGDVPRGTGEEIANEIERMTRRLDLADPDFNDKTSKFRHHLNQAHIHAQRAYELLFDSDGPKRSYFMRSAIGKAQNILITWYVRELKRKEDEE